MAAPGSLLAGIGQDYGRSCVSLMYGCSGVKPGPEQDPNLVSRAGDARHGSDPTCRAHELDASRPVPPGLLGLPDVLDGGDDLRRHVRRHRPGRMVLLRRCLLWRGGAAVDVARLGPVSASGSDLCSRWLQGVRQIACGLLTHRQVDVVLSRMTNAALCCVHRCDATLAGTGFEA